MRWIWSLIIYIVIFIPLFILGQVLIDNITSEWEKANIHLAIMLHGYITIRIASVLSNKVIE